MLVIHIISQNKEYWDPIKNEFINVTVEEQDISLEHSLVSLSKWESRHHKPFLGKEEKTEEEVIDYIKCMTITQNVKDEVYDFIAKDKEKLKKINDYIQDSMTATTFYERKPTNQTGRPHKEIITSELIYYWMGSYQIPFSCEKWHLNRLLTLIRIYNIKNDNGKKMSKNEILANNKALNAARRAKMNSRG